MFSAAACTEAALPNRLGSALQQGLLLGAIVAMADVLWRWRTSCGGAIALCRPRLSSGEGRRVSPLCLPGQSGGNLVTAWWWFFGFWLRLAMGRRHYSGRHLCLSTPPRRWVLGVM